MSEEKATSTQKEQDYKRINMAFSNQNYDFITMQADKLFINYSHFVDYIVHSTDFSKLHDYVESQPMRKGNHSPRKKGHPMKRINIKFDNKVYNIITNEAQKHGTTTTQLLNMMIELYAQYNTIP